MQTQSELKITALGAQGDGVAETADGTSYVAFALPGERVKTGGEGLPRLVSAPSPERVAPACRHFGRCGGCVAQHMGDRLYADWKREIVVGALRQRGLRPTVEPLRRVPAGSRRRAVLTARSSDGRMALGYHRRRSDELIDIEECPVLEGAILAKLPGLRALAALLAAAEVRLTVLATPAGLDVAAEATGRHAGSQRGGGGQLGIGRNATVELGRLATEHGLARVTINGETVIERARPTLRMGEIDAPIPPAAFVQAVSQSEETMRELVAASLAEAPSSPKAAVDLFCGVGTFTFEMARRARVLALDGDAAAVASLGVALRYAQGLKPVEARVRDLFREPLSARELQPFGAVVLDPPRAGALAQARELARSEVETVVAVSCDPGTLARDMQILTDGGYAIASVTPIDQFVYSAHVETVAVLRKRAPGRRGAARRRQIS